MIAFETKIKEKDVEGAISVANRIPFCSKDYIKKIFSPLIKSLVIYGKNGEREIQRVFTEIRNFIRVVEMDKDDEEMVRAIDSAFRDAEWAADRYDNHELLRDIQNRRKDLGIN